MNVIEEIVKFKNRFKEYNGEEPNYVKLGKREVWQLEDWYNTISKPESDKKKVKISNGAMIMGLCVIRTNNKNFIEVGKEDISRYTWKTLCLNPNAIAKVEVNSEASDTKTM